MNITNFWGSCLPAILLSLATAATSLVNECGASEISLVNASFEEPVLADGVYSTTDVPGWTGESNEAGVMNPPGSFFPGNDFVGSNAAYMNDGHYLKYEGSTIILQPNVAYTLTFLAGHRFNISFGAVETSVSLWAGAELLAETFPNPPNGGFIASSLTYTSPPAGSMIGKPIRIELYCEVPDAQGWFDDFHLFAEPDVPPFCSPHKATATAQLVNGVFVGATITDPGCGYTNAPTVLIQGGGGVAATATAMISDGRVTEIRVTNGGCCYTSLPKVTIGSPPFVPTVGIRVSRVMVSQNVVLGRRYVLESSKDFDTWTATGPPFTAESEFIENEFEVDVTGQFFRIFEVP